MLTINLILIESLAWTLKTSSIYSMLYCLNFQIFEYSFFGFVYANIFTFKSLGILNGNTKRWSKHQICRVFYYVKKYAYIYSLRCGGQMCSIANISKTV